MTARPQVLFVLGAGHCGSTLLSLLLNGHSQCVAVSELGSLAQSIANADPVLAQPAWQHARAAVERAGFAFAELDFYHPSWRTFARWSRERVLAWAQPRAVVTAALAEATGRPWIVDASKSWQQLYLMERSGLFDLRVVHLVRDGRGVVHSYTRKYGEIRHGLVKWLKSSVAAMALAPRFTDRWLRVHYEELGSDPEGTLAKICGFADLAYEPAMRSYRNHAWLGLGGNRMSKRSDDSIRLDERWRREMSRRDQLVVGMVGGAINRYYGY